MRNRVRCGQALVWTAVMLPLFLSIIGLAVDGGVVFDARRALQNAADSAARAGAMQVDQDTYRASGGQTVVLDPGSARQAAAAYVGDQGESLTGSVSASPQRVVVTVHRQVPTSFLRIVGITTVQISATATAEVEHGIAQGGSS
jgi:Flp pilus assembly protein TadG